MTSRGEFSAQLAALFSGLGITTTALAADDGITNASGAIHQEATFTANPQRVYEALTDVRKFDRVVRLSDAMKAGYPAGAAPTAIAPNEGGTFSLFGGYITGRHIELVPGKRVVQAWRTAKWKPGAYSIVSFVLTPDASGTKLIFDHTGFPDGEATSLAHGWHANYWEPMTKFFG
jgi:activator of HSP90 ATPase